MNKCLGIVFVALMSSSPLGAGDGKEGEAASGLSGLYIEQESNGLPGQAEATTEKGTQIVRLSEKRVSLFDHRSKLAYLLWLDGEAPRIWRISPDRTQYQEAKDLAAIQSDRARLESEEIAAIKAGAKNADDLAHALAKAHLREDGRRVATLETPPAREGEGAMQRLGYPVKRYVIRENDRVIVDALVTEALAPAIPLFDFYRQAGCFSDEVLEKLREVRGVPLEAHITVITATVNYEIHTVVKRIEQLNDLPQAAFELPPNATLSEVSAQVTCPVCGIAVEKEAPPAKLVGPGIAVYFCSREHKEEWKARQK